MLRILVVVLIVINGLYAAWSLGWLAPALMVTEPGTRTEPQRLQRQVEPASIKVLSPAEAASAVAAAASAAAAAASEPEPPPPAASAPASGTAGAPRAPALNPQGR